MYLLEISMQSRVIIGISAMVLLFGSFLVSFISQQRKKLQYHREIQAIQEKQQQALRDQNLMLEQRVKERTAQLELQKEELRQALADLKASQQLLIQKEKMASLGELTAGIAHEIQNPLNFVNNFSEINADLLTSIRERISGEKLSEAFSIETGSLLDDMKENLDRILLHGKRADNIVKNMLQHSRKQGGEIQPVNLSELTDEYLNLAYHGFRSKNKMFTCHISTTYDENLGPVPVIPEDFGRILVNLLNNSFYSLAVKKKQATLPFEPEISIRTEKGDGKISLKIRDNGTGIPEKIKEKIFQPFFTTKPTGEGTGLGLSLSYDIIKAHGGDLRVESREGEFAEFTIELNDS